MWDLLRERRIATIWSAEMVNEFGNALNFWALAWLLFRAYPDQPWVAATVLSAQAIGLMVGAVVLGPNLDRWERRRALIVGNLAQALLVALIPVLSSAEALAPLVVVAFLVGIASSLTVPALVATLPALVGPEKLQALQALFGLTFSLSNLTAPLASGLLIAMLGGAVVIWFNALTFVVAGICYMLVRFPPQTYAQAGAGSPLRRWWVQVQEGLGFVRARAAVWGILLMISAINAILDPYSAMFLPRVAERLFANVQFPAWLGSDPQAAGLGLFDAVTVNTEFLVTLWLGARSFPNALALRYLIGGCLLVSVGMIGAVLAPNLAVSLMFCALQGLGFGPITVLAGTLLGRLIPEELRGRVGSVRVFVGQGLRPLVLSVVGVLFTPLGLGGIAFALFLIALVLVGFGGSRAIQNLPAE